MTRGNQREVDRLRSQKRNKDQKKKSEDGLSVTQRKMRDAELMRQKQLSKLKDEADGAISSRNGTPAAASNTTATSNQKQ